METEAALHERQNLGVGTDGDGSDGDSSASSGDGAGGDPLLDVDGAGTGLGKDDARLDRSCDALMGLLDFRSDADLLVSSSSDDDDDDGGGGGGGGGGAGNYRATSGGGGKKAKKGATTTPDGADAALARQVERLLAGKALAGPLSFGLEAAADPLCVHQARPSALRGLLERKKRKKKRKKGKKRGGKDRSLQGGGISWSLERAADPFSVHR
jgi:hypothetical protein